jgi:competence protein ComEA
VPTPNERKALWFLAIVALSGTAVRLMRSSETPPTSVQGAALERQLARVDSVRAARRAEQGTRSVGRRRGSPGDRRQAPDASMPQPPPASMPRLQSPAAEPRGPPPPVDLDRATAAEIEALPGIGPALARRIVAHRDSAGAFGALDALCDVRGVGPKLAERLRPLVTFTGPRRPVSDACGGPGSASRKRRRPVTADRSKSF